MTVQIDTTAFNNGVRFSNQTGTAPSAPATNFSLVFTKPDGLYLENSAGQVIGPFITGTSSSSSTSNILSRDKDLSMGTYNNALTENQSIGTNATGTLLNYSGGSPGLITRMTFAISVSAADAAALRSSRLHLHYNGNSSPDVDVPIALFVGAQYAGDNLIPSFNAEYISMSSNYADTQVSYQFNLPIPFSTGIKVDFVNGSASHSLSLWAEIDYFTGVPNTWKNATKLNCTTNTLTNVAVNTVTYWLDISGTNPGRLAGIYGALDGGPGNASPRGAAVEGNFKFYKDGATGVFYQSSGFEDYFGYGFSFQGGVGTLSAYSPSNIGPLNGWTFANGSPGTYHAYRFHVYDPIYFNSGMRVTWNCGDSTQSNFTGGEQVAWAVWYYTS